MIEIQQQVIYNSDYIPSEIFIIVFVMGMVFFLLSFFAHRGQMIMAVIASLCLFFSTFASFYLGWTSEFIINGDMVTQLTTVYTVPPLLYLLFGLAALSVGNIWYQVAHYSQKTLKEAINENEDIDTSMI